MNSINNNTSDVSTQQTLELWGGIECTVVRIQDQYRNQIKETGHADRMEDLDAIAALGIKTLRYPVLWETISPDHPDQAEWGWHDKRLARLRELGIAPIAGLVHHGSGPRYTNLLDPNFPQMLARHAERVARRYPWIDMFTPVNEPLTTARFSALYGHWYPHARDTLTMLRALYIECRATALSMEAIRKVTPHARLVQTEDLGKTFSFPDLKHQADYENERRWLSFDLLCGRIDARHPWYDTFIKAGIGKSELAFFTEQPCAPDIIGINHYVTSERFLDRRAREYPPEFWTDAVPYVDVHATRVPYVEGLTGPEARLREVWERYRLPIAVTEAHLGGSRDDQLRWLNQIWKAAVKLKGEGVDIRAVTIWSIFGCVDWNSLLLQNSGFYESGVFDVRGGQPRPTALAHAAASLAKNGEFDHPVLDGLGWWHRPDRYFQRPSQAVEAPQIIRSDRRLVITGARGTLGQALSRICSARSLEHDLLSRAEMDIADQASVEAALMRHRPWAVINAAGYVRVADAHRESERCMRENAMGAEVLAKACAKLGIPYVTFSSDLVFDGKLGRAYVESDKLSPLCVYGNSKAEAERRVMAAFPDALVVRTSAFFGPWDRYNFVHAILRELAAGRRVEASDDAHVSPTYVPDLAHAVLDLLIDRANGIWHLANQGALSWYEFAERAAREARLDASALVKTHGGGRSITALSSERGLLLPTFGNAFDRYFRENTIAWDADPAERAVA
ncbi:family 1 glycosylhydrolase [Noviherbaspirillum massiliense]|uniref:family 1 glycosylhydrolase n=1 Tax=Noviherbaspirillum massiliense TaxID=1465823 RepID=UPI000319C8CA|nr:family 1 glycosylhydrolase [Noviherbaspirillum massiliense]